MFNAIEFTDYSCITFLKDTTGFICTLSDLHVPPALCWGSRGRGSILFSFVLFPFSLFLVQFPLSSHGKLLPSIISFLSWVFNLNISSANKSVHHTQPPHSPDDLPSTLTPLTRWPFPWTCFLHFITLNSLLIIFKRPLPPQSWSLAPKKLWSFKAVPANMDLPFQNWTIPSKSKNKRGQPLHLYSNPLSNQALASSNLEEKPL